MNIRLVVGAMVVAAATLVATRAVYSEEGAAKQPAMPSEEDMKAMMAAAAPGEEHKQLAAMVGTWDTEMTCEMMPGPSKGSVTSELTLGGRVLLSRFSGDMGGMAFEGVEMRGYDNVKKEHWSVWCDSMGTGFLPLRGQRAKDGKVSLVSDSFQCPMNGPCSMSFTTKFTDADHYEAQMSMNPAGGEPQKATIKYTRRKAAADTK